MRARPFAALLLAVLLPLAACDSAGPGPDDPPESGTPETAVDLRGDVAPAFGGTPYPSGSQVFYVSRTHVAMVGTDGRPRRVRAMAGFAGFENEGYHGAAPDGAGGLVLVGTTTPVNDYTFQTTVVRLDASLDVVWARVYAQSTINTPYSGNRLALTGGDGQRIVVLDLFRLLPLRLDTGEPLAPVAYADQALTWLGGRADADGYTAVGRSGGTLVAARHRWSGERVWARASAPGDTGEDLLQLGTPVPTADGGLLVPYTYVRHTTVPEAGVVRLRADGTVAANWQPVVRLLQPRASGATTTFQNSPRTGSVLRVGADGQVYGVTELVSSRGETMAFTFPIGTDAPAASGTVYGDAVVPLAGGYLYRGPDGLHRGTTGGCTPRPMESIDLEVADGGRPFTLTAQSGLAAQPQTLASQPATITLTDVSLASVPPPAEVEACARLAVQPG